MDYITITAWVLTVISAIETIEYLTKYLNFGKPVKKTIGLMRYLAKPEKQKRSKTSYKKMLILRIIITTILLGGSLYLTLTN